MIHFLYTCCIEKVMKTREQKENIARFELDWWCMTNECLANSEEFSHVNTCFWQHCRCYSVVAVLLSYEHQSFVLYARQSPPVSPAVSQTTVTRTPPKPTTRRSSRPSCWPAPSSSFGYRTWCSSFSQHMLTQNSQFIHSLYCCLWSVQPTL